LTEYGIPCPASGYRKQEICYFCSKKGVREREFENALIWIERADLFAKGAEFDYL
jgi:hypothetical protein